LVGSFSGFLCEDLKNQPVKRKKEDETRSRVVMGRVRRIPGGRLGAGAGLIIV